MYKWAPSDSREWETIFGTISSGKYRSVAFFFHALFTKIIFVLLTSIWFITSKNWWRYAILVPLTMFLFQLSAAVNHTIEYIDEFDFWYSLPVVLPIVFFLIYISVRIGRKTATTDDLKEEVDKEIKKIFSDKL